MAVVTDLCSQDLSFGIDGCLVIAGDRWRHRFVFEDAIDCTPIDMTGQTPSFELLDSTGAVVVTATVTPSPGDATGEFLVTIDDTDTAANIGEFQFRLRIDDGAGGVLTLYCGPFVITECKAA